MPNPLYAYILDTYDLFVFLWGYVMTTFVGYLMPNPHYTYILDIYDLGWFGFVEYQLL